MLGEKGFNEIDMLLLKHLIYNEKKCCFVRTQCDTQINGILDNTEETSAERAFNQLKDEFRIYMNNEVIPTTNMKSNLGRLKTNRPEKIALFKILKMIMKHKYLEPVKQEKILFES